MSLAPGRVRQADGAAMVVRDITAAWRQAQPACSRRGHDQCDRRFAGDRQFAPGRIVEGEYAAPLSDVP
jgi:hypothetical protein